MDSDYAYHEAAHFIVLFRRPPRCKKDLDLIARTIDRFGAGRAQIHEIRVIALQVVTYRNLGWRPSVHRQIGLSWPGIREGVDSMLRGKAVVQTETAARRYVDAVLSRVSQRNSRRYAGLLKEWRGELSTRKSIQ